ALNSSLEILSISKCNADAIGQNMAIALTERSTSYPAPVSSAIARLSLLLAMESSTIHMTRSALAITPSDLLITEAFQAIALIWASRRRSRALSMTKPQD